MTKFDYSWNESPELIGELDNWEEYEEVLRLLNELDEQKEEDNETNSPATLGPLHSVSTA